MKRITPLIFVILLVTVVAFASPTPAKTASDIATERNFVELISAEPVLVHDNFCDENETDTPSGARQKVAEDNNLLTSPSGLMPEDLSLQYDLVGLEQAFVDAETKYGVRADFLAAVAALESGWGRHQFQPNNIMGFGQMEFSSMEECIDTVAAYLAKHYLNPDGKYYNGETVKGVCVRYNGSSEWAETVQQIMEEVRS